MTEMTKVTVPVQIITVKETTTMGIDMIEVGALAMIYVEVIAVRMAIRGVLVKVLGMKIWTEVVLEVILLVLTEIDVQIVRTVIIMTMVETQTKTIAHIGLEIVTVEEMAMIGLPPLWRTPY
jgi:hypothetical protein